jgi:hypothetical protein
MQINDLNSEINSLQFQIDDHEKMFDIALQNPTQLGYAKQIYKDIKLLEAKLAVMINLLHQNLAGDEL